MNDLHVDLYEKIWLWGAAAMVLLFGSAILYSAYAATLHPPSHVETIDPAKARVDARFAEPGVTVRDNGSAVVVILAQMFAFAPYEVKVPANKPITFRLTSPDVIHGFEIVTTNGNTMVVPGYVSQFTTVFRKPGNYLIVCNEYCGLGHHAMQGRLIVEGARP